MPAPSAIPNSTGSIANVPLIIMTSSFNLVFVYERKMRSCYCQPPRDRHYAGHVARPVKAAIVEQLADGTSTSALRSQIERFPNQNSRLDFRGHQTFPGGVCELLPHYESQRSAAGKQPVAHRVGLIARNQCLL